MAGVGDFEYKARFPRSKFIRGFVLMWPGPASIYGTYLLYKAIKEYSEEKKRAEDYALSRKDAIEKYEKEMARIEGNKEKYAAVVQEWNQRSEYLQREFRTVQELLNSFYSMNTLPEPYRNLGSVYYLHRYMSTGRESLRDAFYHEQMESGIQKILAKLDQIVAQNEEIIFHQRIMEAQNHQIIEANYEMLSELEKLNKETNEISKKIGIGNSYIKANTYFAAASYLRQKTNNK